MTINEWIDRQERTGKFNKQLSREQFLSICKDFGYCGMVGSYGGYDSRPQGISVFEERFQNERSYTWEEVYEIYITGNAEQITFEGV